MNLAEVFADPQVVSQEMALAIPHPGHGTVTMTGFPLKFDIAGKFVHWHWRHVL
jgi:CoA:oxalate CoA-transferase